MNKRFIEYGTKINVRVSQSDINLITVVDENNEAYFLMFHGMKELPAIDDRGEIEFVRDNAIGHWNYKPTK